MTTNKKDIFSKLLLTPEAATNAAFRAKLLALGADVNQDDEGYYPLNFAINQGVYKSEEDKKLVTPYVKFLVENGADVNQKGGGWSCQQPLFFDSHDRTYVLPRNDEI